jgi:hypothetical protein
MVICRRSSAWLEQRSFKPKVQGSNPCAGTNQKSRPDFYEFRPPNGPQCANLRPVVRWSIAFIWVTVAAFVAALFSQLLGWEAVRNGVLIAWAVLVLLVAMTRGMRWTSFLTYLSATSLQGAVISQLAGAPDVRSWFLLAWSVFLLPVAIGLGFCHPMRTPAWGLFVGFWGVVGSLWLIVLQILAVAGLLTGAAYTGWTAWPLALLGIWLVVASSLGYGAERFPRWVDGLGLLTGIGLLAISVSTWVGAAELTRAAGLLAAAAYCLWAVGLGRVLWGTRDVSHQFRGLSAQRSV